MAMTTKIETHVLGVHPNEAFEGWDPNKCHGRDYESQRAIALFEAIEANPDDDEYVLCKAQDGSGRWALFGLCVTGHPYAVEV